MQRSSLVRCGCVSCGAIAAVSSTPFALQLSQGSRAESFGARFRRRRTVSGRVPQTDLSLSMNGRLELCLGNSLASCLAVLFSVTVLASSISGLRCYQCGQYTDGPGSITPCINYTDAMHLKDCPPQASKHCIKYVNEASTVRDCADACNEKRSDSWGTSIYCCTEDACNSAAGTRIQAVAALVASTAAAWNYLRLPWCSLLYVTGPRV